MLSFGRLSDIINNTRALKLNKALFFVLNKDDVKTLIIELNTDRQLFEGVDATGFELEKIGGSYTDFTINTKIEESLPFDRITLFQTGKFYGTFSVQVMKTQIKIKADTIKIDENGERQDLQDRWGEDLLGLTDESIEELVQFILPDFIDYIREQILR